MAMGTGFGRLYNLVRPPKQATYRPSIGNLPDLPEGAAGPIWGRQNRSDFMSAAEQLEDVKTVPPRRDALLEEEAFIESQLTQSPAKTSAKLRPLLALAPYVARYRGRAAARLHLADGRGDHHAGGADRGQAHDRFRLQPRRHRADQQLFQRHDRRCRGAGRGKRVTLLPRHDDRRAHRRRSQARRVRASGLAVARLLRFRALGRTGVAADGRYHPDQSRGRRLGVDRAAQHDAVHRRHRHDGDHEPQIVGLRAAGNSADRDSAGRVRALGAAAVAQRAGHAGGRQRLRLRTDRRDQDRAGLYQRAAGDQPLRRRGRTSL